MGRVEFGCVEFVGVVSGLLIGAAIGAFMIHFDLYNKLEDWFDGLGLY